MPQIRRSADRRRRVLYNTHVSPHTPSTPATRRAAEELRAARQPAKAFGSRVHRQLRGRWFSLVPVSRLAIMIVAAVLLAVPIVLTVLHHLTFTWPALAYRDAIARPLQIDRPDSFAAWWVTLVLMLAAGATHLIYIVRRHRRDDYRGHYQLWRLTMFVLLLASVHSTVGLVAWLGAFMDLVFGDRAVLAGANWLRILLDVGGIILAMRLIAEVHRCRPALIVLLCAAAFLGLSESAAWQVIAIDSMTRSTLVIAAPLLGCSCLLVAATIYLRSLYRQVRNIADGPSVRERVARWRVERRNREDDQQIDLPESQYRPRQATIKAETRQPQVAVAKERVQESSSNQGPKADEKAGENEPKAKKPGIFSGLRRQRDKSKPKPEVKSASTQSAAPDESVLEKPKRRWFGLRAAKQIDVDGQVESTSKPEPAAVAPKKRRFSLRLKPQSSDAENDDSVAPHSDAEETPAKEKKGWFGGLLRRKKAVAEDDGSEDEANAERSEAQKSNSRGPLSARSSGPLGAKARNQQKPRPNQSGTSDEMINPDEIDWESMSKAERRRMRKQLKRSGQAA